MRFGRASELACAASLFGETETGVFMWGVGGDFGNHRSTPRASIFDSAIGKQATSHNKAQGQALLYFQSNLCTSTLHPAKETAT
jgi:hypothetical protein